MTAAAFEVAGVLERNREDLSGICSNSWQFRTLHALRKCRTAALGGHIDRCDNTGCDRLHLSYNSCRNRHCPKCQGHKREQWVRAREAELINTPYFHVVFTLPDTLNELCLNGPEQLYGLLFKTAWLVIRDFGKNPKFMGAETGMVAILHTWGQNLILHPHLHCIVPGGGITKSGHWKHSRTKGKFLFPVKAMSKVWRAKYVAEVRKAKVQIPKSVIDKTFSTPWVVYAKRPFGKPEHIVEYLGRYSHKIAISNHRLLNINYINKEVKFKLKNYPEPLRYGAGKKRGH